MRELLNLEINLAKSVLRLKETSLIDERDRILNDLELIIKKRGAK